MWITYRSGFPKMEPYGYTDDSGWGCMLRSAQMLMIQALQRHTLGRCGKNPACSVLSFDFLVQYLVGIILQFRCARQRFAALACPFGGRRARKCWQSAVRCFCRGGASALSFVNKKTLVVQARQREAKRGEAKQDIPPRPKCKRFREPF